jgi:hypothetical protein
VSEHPVDPADMPDETAQDAVEPIEPSSEEPPAPWGDDFNPDRAWRTITHLRDREKELEQQAKQFERLRNDPDAFREFLSEQGYELPEEDDEPDDVEPEVQTFRDPRVDQLLAEREQERLNHMVMEQAAADVKEIQEEIGRELTPKELEKLGKLALPDDKGIPRVALAWSEIKELQGDWQKQWMEGKKTASPPADGVQGSEKFDIRDPEQRLKRMAAIMEANSAG